MRVYECNFFNFNSKILFKINFQICSGGLDVQYEIRYHNGVVTHIRLLTFFFFNKSKVAECVFKVAIPQIAGIC